MIKGHLSQKTFQQFQKEKVISIASAVVLLQSQIGKASHVQSKALPELVRKKSLIISAPPRSGKTVSYLVGAFEILKECSLKTKDILCLCILASRKKCNESFAFAQGLGKAHGISVQNCSSPESFHLLSTGMLTFTSITCLTTLIEAKKISLDVLWSKLKILVIDDSGIYQPGSESHRLLQSVLSAFPTGSVQIVVVGSSVNKAIFPVSLKLMDRLPVVSVDSDIQENSSPTVSIFRETARTEKRTNEYYTVVNHEERLATFIAFLRSVQHSKVLVYFSSDASARFYHELFMGLKMPVLLFVNNQGQTSRFRSFKEFRDCKSGMLFTCKVAHRGLDMKGIKHIVIYDPPVSIQTYIHQIGRTGRGTEKPGSTLLFLWEPAENYLKRLAKVNHHPAFMKIEGNLEFVLTEAKSVVREQHLEAQALKAMKKFVKMYGTTEHLPVSTSDIKRMSEAFLVQFSSKTRLIKRLKTYLHNCEIDKMEEELID